MIKEEIEDVDYTAPNTMHYVVLNSWKSETDPEVLDDGRVHPLETLPLHEPVTELWKYCRVCACAYDVMVPIYDDHGIEMQLEEKINQYLPITVSTNDKLPLQICHSCVDKLNVTHDLIISCLDANSRFTQCLPNSPEYSDPSEKLSELEDQSKDEPGRNEKQEETPKVKKKVVVLKLVHSNSSQLSPSVRIAKALEYLKSKKKVEALSSSVPIVQPNAPEQVQESPFMKPLQKYSARVNPELQVAGIAEFCVVTSGKETSKEVTTGSPKLQSKITEALGTVDKGTKKRIVEAVHHIVSKKSGAPERGCSGCNKGFVSRVALQEHTCTNKLGKANKNGELTCRKCNKKFRNSYKLTVHKQTHKKTKEIFPCNNCDKTFARKDSLQLHKIEHIKKKPYVCKVCGNRFIHHGSLTIHCASEHAEIRPLSCTLCSKKFASKANLIAHHNTHKGNNVSNVAKCKICGIIFCNRFLLKDHLMTHSFHSKMPSKGIFRCPQCPKTFPSLMKLKQHEPIHMGVRPYQCGICSIGFIRKGNLTKHYKTHSTEKVVTCQVCKATFPSVAGLLNHRKSHSNDEWNQINGRVDAQKHITGTESYQCSVCNKFLSSKLSLSLHMRVHTGEKPYQCEICKKRFTQKPALTYHMRLHTGERPHACQYCGKEFNSKVGKESHERIHTGERPYKCGQCGVGFRCSANLRQHTWIHTDNRPFACEECGKPFRRREALQVHMRIHTGERPYACPICGRTFTQKGDMLKHTRSHAKKSVSLSGMECLHCGQVFNRKMHFKMHVEQCTLAKGVLEFAKTRDSRTQLVNIKDGLAVKEGGEELRTVTISSSEEIPKFSEITIVTNDIQEYEVEYQS